MTIEGKKSESEKICHYHKGSVGEKIEVTVDELMRMYKGQYGYTLYYGKDQALNITGKIESADWIEARAYFSNMDGKVIVHAECEGIGQYEGNTIRSWKFKVN